MIYFFLIFWASIFTFLWWHSAKRKKGLQAVASRLGLHYLGEVLPRSFSLRSPVFKNVTAVWNVLDGDRNDRRMIAFDYRIGRGKQSRTKTVIAVDVVPADLESLVVRYNTLSIESAGHWSFLFEPRRFPAREVMFVSELETYIESVLSMKITLSLPK